jgi:pyruvate, orthophosphate dikinase
VVLLDGTARLPHEILGKKGYGIDAMRRHQLPVPPAFCIATEVCAQSFADPEHCLYGLREVTGLFETLSHTE